MRITIQKKDSEKREIINKVNHFYRDVSKTRGVRLLINQQESEEILIRELRKGDKWGVVE